MPTSYALGKTNDSGDDMEATTRTSNRKGWFITPVTAFIIVLAALALAAIVGLIVGLAHPDRGKTSPPEGSKSFDDTVDSQSSSEESSLDVRLPDTLIPYHYNLRLRPDIYDLNPENFESTGSVEIFLTCVKPTNVITLHARNLRMDREKISVTNIKTGRGMKIARTSKEKEQEFFNIHLTADLAKDNRYKISFRRFTGPIKDDLKGIYYSSYKDGAVTKYLLASQIQPVDGRQVFPCMDEPNLKASFNVTLERKKDSGYKSMSNMKIWKTEDVDEEWTADYFEKTPEMSLYLLGIVISDFNCVTNKTQAGLDVDVCSRPNAFDQTHFASTIAAPMQDWFAEYHNVSYPLEKNSHVAVPDFSSGAMENWGIIIYRESNLLLDQESTTSYQRQGLAGLVSHELAHMWFGNLVTMKWWDDIWLNEGFASYMSIRGVDGQFPEWYMEGHLVTKSLQGALELDALPTSHPVYLKVNDPEEISQMFDIITYYKGSSIIWMMRNFLGEQTFRDGISNYLKDRTFKLATHHDLFAFLTQQAKDDGKDIDVHEVMNTWILQMGYPVVTFTFDKSGGKISLKQEHFLLDPKSHSKVPSSPYNYIWRVPITLATDLDGPSHWVNPSIQWLNEATGEITGVPADAKWIVGNLNSSFYYRVNYDEATWNAIRQQLNDDHLAFSVNTRSQLIDDAFKLGRAGIIDQTLALEIASYLKKEEDLYPWRSFTSNIKYLSDMLVVTGAYGDLQKYIRTMLNDVYTDSLLDKTTLDPIRDHTLRLRRTIILSLACGHGYEKCIKKASEQFQAWMNSTDGNPIDVDLRPTVYCTGLAAGGQAEWEFAFNKFAETNSGAESENILKALGCTRQDWLLRRYMEDALAENPPVRRQDFKDIIKSIAGNSIGRNIAWESFVSNYDTIFKKFGDTLFTFTNMVDGLTAHMSTQYEYDMVQSFVESQSSLGTAETAFKQALDKIKVNMEWKENNQDEVIQWLKAK